MDLNSWKLQLPAIDHLSDAGIEQCRVRLLKLDHPCHNQSIERLAKLVTEALDQVEGLHEEMEFVRLVLVNLDQYL